MRPPASPRTSIAGSLERGQWLENWPIARAGMAQQLAPLFYLVFTPAQVERIAI